ncbi:hypothetical protein KDX31_02720 [Amphritea atlantica]|uniref:DUF4878 domain-containing protein n=1 Tax=Amphritea atlantica TaxID=355243 RepID=A0ABY5GVD7_9GAMM|nr:hypothetical protein KDX31_02720 [Amphritea atlantica]
MKKLVKILLGLVGVFVLAIVAVFYFTSDMVASADEFFTAIKNKDMNKAYTYLSEDFQANTSQSDLEAYLQKNLIHKFKEASWESRSINGGRGSLIGSITTESGGVVPITLSFVKGKNGWKIYSLQKPSSGIQEESSPVEMPSEQEQVQLVSRSMRVFAASVNEKSMAKFHSYVSNLWQQEFTVEKFDEAFGAFYNVGVDLTVLDNYSPQFKTKPSIDENGVLVITGHYPTEPSQVYFEQKYVYEGLGWKLVGFSTNIK